MRRTIALLLAFSVGVVAGGYAFHRTLPRSFLEVPPCDGPCIATNELAGILASVGIQFTPGLLPFHASESQRCVAVKHPKPEGRYHMVYLPKRDVRHLLEMTQEDLPYLADCLALAREDAARARVRDYRLVTNGPKLQHVSYTHIHIIAR